MLPRARASEVSTPRVGIGCIVHHAGQVLLVRSHRGLWSTPGGHLDFGEAPEVAAARETLEETGVRVRDVQFLGVSNDVFGDPTRHYLTVWFRAAAVSRHIEIGDPEEIAEAGWFDPDHLPDPKQYYFAHFLAGGTLPSGISLLPDS